MEKTIKYLENGEYHYATVRDVGDLAKLKTDSKEDLVAAINDLFDNGGQNAGKPDGYDKLVEQVADSIKNQQDLSKKIDSAQKELNGKIDSNTSTATDLNKQAEEIRQDIEAMRQNAIQQQKLLDEQVNKLKAASQDLDKKTADLANDIEAKFSSAQNDYKTVSENLNNEAATLHKQLGDVKSEAEQTRSQLQDQAGDIGNIHKSVDDLSEKVSQKIWMSDLDPVKQQVTKNSTEVQQTKDQLLTKADQSNLDLVSNSVENLSTQVKENAAGLKVSVKKDELGGDVARLLNDKTNLLLGTRNFSGDSWGNKTYWHEEAGYWKGLKVFSSTEIWFGLQYKYEVKQGQQYTFSFWARQEKDNSSASIVLSESDKGDQGITTPYTRGVHIGTEWKRYSLTFQAVSDGIIYPRVEQNVQGNKLYIAGYKLELGNVATPWEPNEADVAENIEHNESQFNVYSDQIAGIVKKQEKMGDTERQLDTRITETAEGLKQTSKDLQDANGKITEFKGQLESTARGLKTEYEKYTNDAIGQISDSSLNLIRNSAFQNKDDNFAQWQNVSAKANIREDGNGLRWVELTQSGMTTSNPQGITSNYFVVKQGKVTVAVDIKSGDKVELDNESVLFLELYDNAKKRVDFHWITLSDLGLSKSLLNDHQVHRGLYRLAIDRTDAQYMTVKAHLIRNGDLWFTNFSARLSSIDDGGYTPNPDDLSQQILKMNTKIEEDAEHIALKANSVDVTRDIKSAVQNSNGGGINLLKATDFSSTDLTKLKDVWGSNFTLRDGKAMQLDQLKGNGDLDATQFLPVEPDTDYTLSFEVYYNTVASGGSYNNIYTFIVEYKDQNNTTPHYLDHKRVVANTADRSKNTQTIHTQKDCHYVQVFFRASTKTLFSFWRPKLERGPVATPWTPNSQDTSEEIKSAKDAAIKVASDQIDLHVNELRTSFDDKLSKQINEAKSASQKFTSDGIEQTVKKITDVKNGVDKLGNRVDGVDDKVNNLQVGGRNYISPSQIAGNSAGAPQYDSNSQVWTVNVGNGVGGSWGGGIQFAQSNMSVPWGKAYTDSVEVYVTDSDLKWQIDINNYGIKSDPNLAGNDNDDRGRAVIIPSTNDSLPTNQWVKLSVTVWNTNPKNTNHTDLWDGSSFGIINQTGHTVTVKFRRPKQELGSKATDWSPNPDDTTKEIKSAQDAAIKIASDQINLHVNELSTSFDDKLNKRVDEVKTASEKFTSDGIEQVVTKVTDVKNDVNNVNSKLDNLQIGTRNLLHHSDAFDGWHKGSSVSISSEKYLNGSVAVLQNSGSGGNALYSGLDVTNDEKHITWTVYARADNNGDKLHTELWGGGGLTDQPLTTEWKRYKFSGDHADTYNSFYLWGVNTNKGNIYVALPFAVIGNTIGSWSPNPEDIDQTIKDATEYKTVTGTIDFNNLKTQQKIFYKDTQATNAPAGGSYWYYLNVEPGTDGRIFQTAISDRDNITWVRTFADSWSPWIRQADQRNVDDLNNQISSFKTETTTSVKNLGDRVTTEVNSVTKKINSNNGGGVNLLLNTQSFDQNWTWDSIGHSFANGILTLSDTNNGNSRMYQGIAGKSPAGRTFTLSFNARISDDCNSEKVGVRVGPYDAGKSIDVIGKSSQSYKLEGWQWTGTSTTFSFYVIGGKIDISNLKLEYGYVATPWSQAPEDVNEAIKSVNTKLDVANGQIQGKVTATDVNNILNGKGYATQSWAQTMFTMKSDAITLQAVRDNITNGIQNQVNSLQGKLDGDLSNLCHNPTFSHGLEGWNSSHLAVEGPWSEMPTPKNGTLFVRDAYYGDYFPVSKGERYYTSVFAHNGDSATFVLGLCFQLKDGSLSWLSGSNVPGLQTGKFDGYVDVPDNAVSAKIWVSIQKFDNFGWVRFTNVVVKKNDAISQINLSPDNIRLLSNKIEIDGNTYIHGDLQTENVRLVGKKGVMDLSGDSGLVLQNNNGSIISLGESGLDLKYKNDFEINIDSQVMTLSRRNGVLGQEMPIAFGNIGSVMLNKDTKSNGFMLRYNPGSPTDPKLAGANFMSFGYNTPNPGEIQSQMILYAKDTEITGAGVQKKGIHFLDNLIVDTNLTVRFPQAHDMLYLCGSKWDRSQQSGYFQPTITIKSDDGNIGTAGVTFQWGSVKPFGDLDLTDTNIWMQDANGKLRFGWITHDNMWNGKEKFPALYRPNDSGGMDSGIAFAWGSTWDLGTGAHNLTAAAMNTGN